MTQDTNNPKHFIADNGNVFRRINNGFEEIENPMVLGKEIILGQILVDKDGNMLAEPIDDNIEYYDEIPQPEPKRNINREDMQFTAANIDTTEA